MIKVLGRMPNGTLGLEAVGKVTDDDFREVLVPAAEAALERGDTRLLFVFGDDFDSFSLQGAWWQTRTLAGLRKGWTKVAVVADADWLEHGAKAFDWLTPGDLRVFDDDEFAEARAWLATP
jgi:hypothetical protein